MTRLTVRKTYKLFINGQFPRSESGRTNALRAAEGGPVIANVARGSRKDVKAAVRAARHALGGWAIIQPYLRGQILYRVAELCEARSAELAQELERCGVPSEVARTEVQAAVDRFVYYAGFTDKVQLLLGGVNAVSGPYHCFSKAEPVGVVGIVAPEEPALCGLAARLAPALACGNTAVVVASESRPLAAVALAEVLATSDVPAGVVNVITGLKQELAPALAAHLDVDAIDRTGAGPEAATELERLAAENLKRVVGSSRGSAEPLAPSLEVLAEFTEIKTVWHPLGF